MFALRMKRDCQVMRGSFFFTCATLEIACVECTVLSRYKGLGIMCVSTESSQSAYNLGGDWLWNAVYSGARISWHSHIFKTSPTATV